MNYWIVLGVVGILVLIVIVGLVLYFVFREKCPTCAEGEKCYKGECVPKTQCTPSCKEGEICINGVCEKESTLIPCSVDTDCKSGFHCVKGYCLDTCLSDSSCPGSQVCVKGICKLKMCLYSNQCAPNEGCLEEGEHSYCQGSITCTSSSPCPEGLICDGGICKQCVEDSQCPSKNCKLGRCVTCSRYLGVPAVECSSVKDCSRDGVCCPPEGFSKVCSSDKDCTQDNPYCIKTLGIESGVCSCTKYPNGFTCEEKEQCQSGKCKDICFSGECFNFTQCKAGEYCREGLCTKEILGSHCYLEVSNPCIKEGYFCVNNICQKTPGTYGSTCRNNKDCEEDYTCKLYEGYLICQPK